MKPGAIISDDPVGDPGAQLSKLIADNKELRDMVTQLFERGVPVEGGTNLLSSSTAQRYDLGQFKPPQPHQAFEGEISKGRTFKFRSDLEVVDIEGHVGVTAKEANVYENAFLQLQLMECFEINARKDENMKAQ